MSLFKSSGLAIFAAVCLLGGIAGSAHAQCNPFPNFVCATEWSDGRVINLGGESDNSVAFGINDRGQVVGLSRFGLSDMDYATEWSHGNVINLGVLPGSAFSDATSINNRGEVAGYSLGVSVRVVPEPSTWAMMLLGFAGLALVGYRRAKAGRATLSC
jgi:probable HAF family extracellular repeat protein